jgi:hypothetical protein
LHHSITQRSISVNEAPHYIPSQHSPVKKIIILTALLHLFVNAALTADDASTRGELKAGAAGARHRKRD